MRLGTVWLAVTLALAFVRLLSEIPGREKRKEKRMKATRASVPNSQSGQPRKFLQYLLETIWAAGAGVLGTSLAVLTGHVDRLILLLGNCDWVSLRHDCSD